MARLPERNGVWVETDQGIGIRNLHSILIGDVTIKVPKVDIVDPATGVTLAAEIPESALSNVRIARAASIPRCRVEHLNTQQLARLGYV